MVAGQARMTHVLEMLITQPPYALSAATFRFPALASLAGRAPLGGRREVALAAYLAARLIHDALPDRGVPASQRAERAAHAKTWLSTLSLPAPARPALVGVIEASSGEQAAMSEAVRKLVATTASFLDAPARSELDALAVALERA